VCAPCLPGPGEKPINAAEWFARCKAAGINPRGLLRVPDQLAHLGMIAHDKWAGGSIIEWIHVDNDRDEDQLFIRRAAPTALNPLAIDTPPEALPAPAVPAAPPAPSRAAPAAVDLPDL
jgi:hypothetical protein